MEMKEIQCKLAYSLPKTCICSILIWYLIFKSVYGTLFLFSFVCWLVFDVHKLNTLRLHLELRKINKLQNHWQFGCL